MWWVDKNGSIFSSGIHPQIAFPNTTYSVLATDQVVLCNASGGAFTVTLPSAVTQSRSQYTIVKVGTDANAVTVASASGAINSASTYSLAASAYHAVTVISDGTNWNILDKY